MSRLNLPPGTTLFLHKEGQTVGPYSLQQIEDLLSRGEILPNEFAWSQGWLEWKMLNDLLTTSPQEPPPQAPESRSNGQEKVFVRKNGEQLGPFTVNEVAGQLAQKTLSENDSVWVAGWPVWAPASCLRRLDDLSPPALPPILPNQRQSHNHLPYRDLVIVASLIIVPLIFMRITWSVGHSLYLWASPLLVLGLLIIASGPIYFTWRGTLKTLPIVCSRLAVVLLSACVLGYLLCFAFAVCSLLARPLKASGVASTEYPQPPTPPPDPNTLTEPGAPTAPTSPVNPPGAPAPSAPNEISTPADPGNNILYKKKFKICQIISPGRALALEIISANIMQSELGDQTYLIVGIPDSLVDDDVWEGWVFEGNHFSYTTTSSASATVRSYVVSINQNPLNPKTLTGFQMEDGRMVVRMAQVAYPPDNSSPSANESVPSQQGVLSK